MGGTDHHTSRFQANVGPVRAVVALGRAVRFRIDVDGIVRAGLQAGLAANANSGVKLNDTIITLVHRGDRTNTHTGRIGTVVTASHLKKTAGIGKFAFFNIFNPGSADA